MKLSWEAGRPARSGRSATIADGVAVRVAIPIAVEALASTVDRMVEVSEREIVRAIVAFDDAGIRVEGAAATTLAALPQLDNVGGPIVLVVTGRNIDPALLARCREESGSFAD